ncbi:MAG: cytochrome C [Hyphomicrobiales bacterium]|nr:MAG: cytochrome C [Hyphomicrobiales bacterium]
MSKRRLAVGGVMLAVAAVAYSVIVARGHPENAVGLFRPDDPAVVASGRVLYVEHCAACHGDNLEGQPDWKTRGADGLLPAPPHDETGHTWHHTDDVLFGITKQGVARFAGLDDYQSSMQPFEGVLSDDEIIAVLSYIKSRWPEQVRRRHDQMNAAKAASSG